jgi:chromatin segregation and condensation protein Rec8/ScpA/Scc1 (kleisin family)
VHSRKSSIHYAPDLCNKKAFKIKADFLVHNSSIVRIKSRMACGNQAGAEAAYREFAEWMKRPDRKDFDSTGRLEALT